MDYKKYNRRLKAFFMWGVDGLLPPRCPQTGQIVDRVGALSVEAWRALTFISDPKCSCCGFPFNVSEYYDESSSSQFLCGDCLETPKPYVTARSVLVYDEHSKGLILGFKHGDQTYLKKTFAPLLAGVGSDMLAKADLLVPVPLHWRRLLKRRYNQSGLLASSLSEVSGISCSNDVLVRVRHTPPQGHKSNKDRHENVRGAFAVKPGKHAMINGKNLVLLDDVFTTGATLEACVRALMYEGAAKVDVLTLARVVKAH